MAPARPIEESTGIARNTFDTKSLHPGSTRGRGSARYGSEVWSQQGYHGGPSCGVVRAGVGAGLLGGVAAKIRVW